MKTTTISTRTSQRWPTIVQGSLHVCLLFSTGPQSPWTKNPPQSLTLCTVNEKKKKCRRTFIRTRRISQTQPGRGETKKIDARISDGTSSVRNQWKRQNKNKQPPSVERVQSGRERNNAFLSSPQQQPPLFHPSI